MVMRNIVGKTHIDQTYETITVSIKLLFEAVSGFSLLLGKVHKKVQGNLKCNHTGLTSNESFFTSLD